MEEQQEPQRVPLDQETLAKVIETLSPVCKQEMETMMAVQDPQGRISEQCQGEIQSIIGPILQQRQQQETFASPGGSLPLETEAGGGGSMVLIVVIAVVLLALTGMGAYTIYINAELQKAGYFEKKDKKLSKKKMEKLKQKEAKKRR